ncbi:unnamed protein product [Thlaspi arvense]|uniref:Uncharacterized protein n=1 Tax=Thlaspi arvense TaxID=13288 RepID=A0AAU9RSL8_THLAR|nr:unnamed protein product [Thlaspi arvense]
MMVNQTMSIIPMTAGAPGVPGPTTNLNIGMDYWGAAGSSTLPAVRGKAPPTPVAGGMVTAGSRESLQSQLWLQGWVLKSRIVVSSSASLFTPSSSLEHENGSLYEQICSSLPLNCYTSMPASIRCDLGG